MQVKCSYCGNMISDTLEQCPHCGAPNDGVKRTADSQPKTIEELKQWYHNRGLPPYETTRFFIGIDYKKPRAFGIYLDEQTGNYIVYKNKDSGARAIRYEGKDEAYAVNELLQRLKQGILQQKALNKNAPPEKPGSSSSRFLKSVLKIAALCIGGFAALIAAIVIIGALLIFAEPKEGYYDYQGNHYYHSSQSMDSKSWYIYAADGTWSDPLDSEQVPDELEKKSSAKPYFLSSDWNLSIPCSNFSASVQRRDLDAGSYVASGYYEDTGTVYYHLGSDYSDGWYAFDGRWKPAAFEELPYSLRHSSTAPDSFLGLLLTSRIQATDFTETLYYRDYCAPSTVAKGYYEIDDIVFYHLADEYDEGWYTYEDDDWVEAVPEFLPETFSHPSILEDYYFTPTWDASTQYSDFEDTWLYSDNKDNWNNDSDSDSDYDWDDSFWDSDFSDWDSDW